MMFPRLLPGLGALLLLTACWEEEETSPKGGGDPSPERDGDTGDTGADTADTGAPLDSDGDGYPKDVDCDDGNAAVNPGVTEVCNGVDDDCDGTTDIGAADAGRWYDDVDGDGWGDDSTLSYACSAPSAASVSNGGDCDPADGATYPGAEERCDGLDRDCDGSVADGVGVWHDGTAGWTDHTDYLLTGSRAGLPLTVNGGTLHVCDGTWLVNLTVTADATIIGHGAAPVLDGGGSDSVVVVTAGVDVTIEDLTLTGGAGHSSWSSGGAVYCPGGGSVVTLNDSVVTGNTADLGAGVYAVDCDVFTTNTTFSDNVSAQDGGALYLMAYQRSVAAFLTDTTLATNSAARYGGGIAAFGSYDVDIDLYDSYVTGNTSTNGAGMFLHTWVAAACHGSSTIAAGFHDNTATADGAVVLYSLGNDATLLADACDFGTGATDNAASDITIYTTTTRSYAYGDDATVNCTTYNGTCY